MNVLNVIRSACQAPSAYSKEFTAQVDQIGRQLSDLLGVEIRHDTDMNYRAGQSLAILLQVEPPTGRGKAAIEIRIYISSKARLFAFYCLDLNQRFVAATERNHPVSLDRLPASAREVIETCRKTMLEAGYQEVPQELFDEKLPGCETELDGLPASVFQALFAEIV